MCRVMQDSCQFGDPGSWVCFWQVKRQWKSQNQAQTMYQNLSKLSCLMAACARGGARPDCAGHTPHMCVALVPLLHMGTWCCMPCHRHRVWHARLICRQNARRHDVCVPATQLTAGPFAGVGCGSRWSGPPSRSCKAVQLYRSPVVEHCICQSSQPHFWACGTLLIQIHALPSDVSPNGSYFP